jgi:hypothetical protein
MLPEFQIPEKAFEDFPGEILAKIFGVVILVTTEFSPLMQTNLRSLRDDHP